MNNLLLMPQIYTNPVRCGIIYKEIKRGECRAKTDAAKVKIVEIMDEIPESIGTRTKPQQFDMASYFAVADRICRRSTDQCSLIA